MKRTKQIAASLLALAMTVTGAMGFATVSKAENCGGLEEEDVYWPEAEDVVQDPILNWSIRVALNAVKSKVTLTEDMVGDKSVQYISYEMCNHIENFADWKLPYYVESLEGIQYAKNTKMVDIGYTTTTEGKRIADLSPLAGLTQLEDLILKQNGIDDVSALAGLVNLKSLDLSGNKLITDVTAIKDMRKLGRINLSANQIRNVEDLKGLEELKFIDISDNEITELPDLSRLTKVTSFDASNNKLTDVSAVAGLSNLTELNLKNNQGIKDLKPLAKLYNLEKDKTYLSDDSAKEDLFAAIEVNKLFREFNISKMQEEDLPKVKAALDAYDTLTSSQKEYIESKRVQAARDNMDKIKNGEAIEYYPEYDEGGEKTPVLDRLQIKVVDKKGKPLSGVAFEKKGLVTSEYTTDENGMISIIHSTQDQWYWNELSVRPKGDRYVAVPEEITYSVKNGITVTINGKPATGLEELQFVLIPKEEYVEKSHLQKALEEASAVEEEYKYTEESYRTYKDALEAAKAAYEDPDSLQSTVDSTAENLTIAYGALTKADLLTELKLTVKDSNGNLFTRPFKFQIRVPGTGAEAWNQLSDAKTGTVYLKVSPLWEEGKTWEIVSCYEEPYEIEPIIVTIGVDNNGKRCYKTINGEAANIDSALEVTAKALPDGAPDSENERKPDSTVLRTYIEEGKQYHASDYTPLSFKELKNALDNGESMLQNPSAVQEDFNACAAAIKKAEAELSVLADKTALKKELDIVNAYEGAWYTSDSWEKFAEKRTKAGEVYEDPNASQELVDNTLMELQETKKALLWKASDEERKSLKEKLEEAKAYKESDYISGFEELQTAIGLAQQTYDNPDASGEDVNGQTEALKTAIAGLEKKPAEVPDTCTVNVFRAKVMDSQGSPLEGVRFETMLEGEESPRETISDSNGIIEEYTYMEKAGEKTATVRLADDRYTTEDVHTYTMKQESWVAKIVAIDGQPYEDGIRLTYTLKAAGGETPQPETVDKTGLKEQIDLAKGYDGKEAEYTADSYAELQSKLTAAETVYNDENAAKEQVEEKTEALKTAIAGLEKKPAEVPDTCTVNIFRAKVMDSQGSPLEGVRFETMLEGEESPRETISDSNGIIEEYTYMEKAGEKTATVRLADDRYTTEDVHTYTMKQESWVAKIVAIDGQPYEDGIRLTYTLKAAGGETPQPETVDKTGLKEQIDLAKGYDGKEAEYTADSYAELQSKLTAAETVYNDENAAKEQVEEKTEALKTAIAGLEKKPAEVPDTCTVNVFRAKVMDSQGSPLEGVRFETMLEGEESPRETISDSNGIIEEYTYMEKAGEKTATVRLADDRYTTEDVHTYTMKQESWVAKIVAIDGQPYEDGIRLTYTLKAAGGETPQPETVDKTGLKEQIDLAKGYDGKEAEYTADSYAELQSKLTAAETVYNDENAAKEQVEEKTEALKTAIAGLEKKPAEGPGVPDPDHTGGGLETDGNKPSNPTNGGQNVVIVKQQTKAAKTGDTAQTVPFVCMMAGSVLAAAIILKKGKR